MKSIITYEKAVLISLILFGLIAGFHLTILIGMLFFSLQPLEFLWGGRMESVEELIVFEIISLLLVSLNTVIVLIHSGKLNLPRLKKTSTLALWVFFVLFLLNTLGNITAPSAFEKSASVVTAILAFLSLRMALHKA
jgi:hypothetical protein